MANTQKVVVSNLIWRFAERCGAQFVSFAVSIILARILAPDDYGTIALVTVFTSFLNIFINSGLGVSLIQKSDADELDFSTVFWFNIVSSIVLYAMMFFAAPVIADFYERRELIPVIRVLSLTLLISGVKNIQLAYVSRKLIFKKFFFATLAGTVGAAVIGIYMAYNGYGVWALVAQYLFNGTVDTIILWITVKFRPKLKFSLTRWKQLFSFGWKMLLSQLIDTGYNELRQLIIGKIYSSSDLAFYNKGKRFPNIIVTNINSSIDSVLLPTMSNVQDNKERVRSMTRRSIKTSVFVMAPLLFGLAATSKTVVTLLLTEKWLETVPYLCVFCVTYVFYPIHTANLNAIKAMGRSDLFLNLEILKKIIGIMAVLITMFISPFAMCLSLLVTTVISQIINSWPNRKLLDYSIWEQWKDILPSVILAAFMAATVWGLGKAFVSLPLIVSLIIQIAVGAIIYVGGAYLLKIDSFEYVLGILRLYIKQKRE